MMPSYRQTQTGSPHGQHSQRQQMTQAPPVKRPTTWSEERQTSLAMEPWVQVQKNTFERWVNTHLMKRQCAVVDLFEDLRDGVRLCYLMEMLSRQSVGRVNKFPKHYQQKIENHIMSLKKIQDDGVKLVNIGPEDIETGNGKLTLGLMWSIILKYQISANFDQSSKLTPAQWLLDWLRTKLQPKGLRPNNLTTDWNDGKLLPALVDAVYPGLFPDWNSLPNAPISNIKQAMILANDWLDCAQLMNPEDMANPNVDDKSMMTYLSQFVGAANKMGAPLGQFKALNAGNVRVYGPALENDVKVNTTTRFFIDSTNAGNGKITLGFGGPAEPKVDIKATPDKPQEISFTAPKAGDYDVNIKFAGKDIPHSPVRIHVVPAEPDSTKVRVTGLGPRCAVGPVNTFNIDGSNAGGTGFLEIGVLGPSVPANQIFIEHKGDQKFDCKFVVVEKGTFLVNVKWHGAHVPGSPFEILGTQ